MEFPIHIFPKVIQGVIEDTHRDMNFPKSYIAASLLLAMAVAIGNSRKIRVRGNWSARPILYMALIGRPGALKSHPISFALDPLRRSDISTLEKYAKELEEYRKEPIGAKPRASQIIVKDATIEALAKVMQTNKHGVCLHHDELLGWFSGFNKYRKAGGDQEQWLSLFNGDPVVINRKTHDDIVSITHPFVCVVGSLQPAVISKTFRERTDNGFLYRILFVFNPNEDEPLLWGEDDLPSDAPEQWSNFLLNMYYSALQLEEEEGCLEYKFDEQAHSMITVWHNVKEVEYNEAGEDHRVAIFRKMQDYAMRFCLVIQTMREIAGEVSSTGVVDGVTVARALALTEYFIENASRVYEDVHFSKSEESSKILTLIDALPLVFSREQAIAIGKELGLSRRTIFRYIRGEHDDLFFEKLSHGKYRKR